MTRLFSGVGSAMDGAGRVGLARALGLAAALVLGAGAAFAQDATFDRTLEVSGPADVDVSTGSGDITIRAGAAGTVEVRGRVRRSGDWRASARVDEDIRFIAENPPIEQSGNIIRIGRVDRDRREGVRISYEVIVPADSGVSSRTGSGRTSVSGVAGPLEARSGSGAMDIARIAGDVEASTGSGTIDVSGVEGEAMLRTGSGSIRATGMNGQLHASTGSGHIEVAGTLAGDWSLRAGSGSLTADVPEDAGFELRAQTNSGRIDSDHPITVQGRVGGRRLEGTVRGGGTRLDMRTSSGSIRIR